MRTFLRPLVIAACLAGPGCQFVCHIGRNLVHEPIMACDEKQMKRRNVKLGKQAWNEMVKQYGDCFSCDYRRGFVDGFADYLTYGGCFGDSAGADAGGCGSGCDTAAATAAMASAGATKCGTGNSNVVEYPVCRTLPPERYHRKRYATPEGCKAVEDWYAGFRHGAATAMASGLRSVQVIPVQCPPKFSLDDGGPLPKNVKPTSVKDGGKDAAPPMPPPEQITHPSAETLPQPRPMNDGGAQPPILPPPGY